MYSIHPDVRPARTTKTPGISYAVVCCCPLATPMGWFLVWRLVRRPAPRPESADPLAMGLHAKVFSLN